MSITAVQPSTQNIISIPTETLQGVKRVGKKRKSARPFLHWRIDTGTHSQKHALETQVVFVIAKLLPFHGYLPFAHLLSIHIIEVACVVVWICAAEDQFSTWKVFWVSERINWRPINSISYVLMPLCSSLQKRHS